MRSHFRSERLWALLLAFAFFFLIGAATAHGQTSEPPSLQTIIGYAQTLEARLELREAQAKAQVTYWQNIVEALKEESENDKKRSTELLEMLEVAQAELLKSQTAYAEIVRLLALSDQAFNDYRSTTEQQIKGLELRIKLYKSASIVVSASLAATGIYILGDRLEWW